MENLKITLVGAVIFAAYNAFQFVIEGGNASAVGLRLFLLIIALFLC